MKKLFFSLILTTGIFAAAFGQNVLKITNGGYSAITLEMYYNSGGTWQFIGALHIPGGVTKTMDLGREFCSSYGYVKTRTQSHVRRIGLCNLTVY